jgi:predicted nuclease with TOPRIM domain
VDPAPSDRAGFDRLERAIVELLDRHEALRRENSRLAEALAARDRRVEELESRFREGNQLQRDVAKRIDDLLGQIDQIEHHFAERGA